MPAVQDYTKEEEEEEEKLPLFKKERKRKQRPSIMIENIKSKQVRPQNIATLIGIEAASRE